MGTYRHRRIRTYVCKYVCVQAEKMHTYVCIYVSANVCIEMSYAKLHTQALGTLVFKHLIWQSHRDTRHFKVVYCIFALVCVCVLVWV